jgi:hypothetical protein
MCLSSSKSFPFKLHVSTIGMSKRMRVAEILDSLSVEGRPLHRISSNRLSPSKGFKEIALSVQGDVKGEWLVSTSNLLHGNGVARVLSPDTSACRCSVIGDETLSILQRLITKPMAARNDSIATSKFWAITNRELNDFPKHLV